MSDITIKLNVDMLQYKKGSVLTLTNKKHSGWGIFLSPYFRKRIEDSKIDNCLEILETTETSKANPKSNNEEYNIDQDDQNHIVEIDKPKKRGRPKTKKIKD